MDRHRSGGRRIRANRPAVPGIHEATGDTRGAGGDPEERCNRLQPGLHLGRTGLQDDAAQRSFPTRQLQQDVLRGRDPVALRCRHTQPERPCVRQARNLESGPRQRPRQDHRPAAARPHLGLRRRRLAVLRPDLRDGADRQQPWDRPSHAPRHLQVHVRPTAPAHRSPAPREPTPRTSRRPS